MADHPAAAQTTAGRRRNRSDTGDDQRNRLLRDLRDPGAADRRADAQGRRFSFCRWRWHRPKSLSSRSRRASAASRTAHSAPARLRCPERCTRLAHRPAFARAMPLRICKFRNGHDRSVSRRSLRALLLGSFRIVAAMRPRGNGPGNSDSAANQRHRAEPDRPAQAAGAAVHNRRSGSSARRASGNPAAGRAADRHRPVRDRDRCAKGGNPAQPRLDLGRRAVLANPASPARALRRAHRAGRSSAASTSIASASSTTASAAAACPTSAKTISCRSIRWQRTRSR